MSAGRPPTLWCDLIIAATLVRRRRTRSRRSRASPARGSGRRRGCRASSSKTRMNSSPTIVALLLGIVDAGEPREEALLRLRRARAARGSGRRTSRRPASASFSRSRPWSTKTHVSWSPTALWTSSAATAESTPPESAAEHALAADLRADPLDLLLDHRRGRPRRRRAARRRRGSSSAPPCRAACARPRGGTGRRRGRAPASSKAAIGVDGEPATTRAPVGGATTESRWLIQTVCSAGRSSKSAPTPRRAARSCRTREAPVRSTRPPRSSAISCMP